MRAQLSARRTHRLSSSPSGASGRTGRTVNRFRQVTASAFATATALQQHYGWWVGVPATLAAGYVATARVHDAKHYLSDVIFGGALGVAAQRTVMLRGGRYGFAFNAVPLRGGGGFSVSMRPR